MWRESVVGAVRLIGPEGVEVPAGPGGTITLKDPGWPEGPAGVGPWVVVDFGDEVFGEARCVVRAVQGGDDCYLRVRVGESVSEAMHGMSLATEREARAGESLATERTGFRFARVDLLDPDRTVTLAPPEATDRVRDLPRLGSFRSSDARLDRIWEAGARTAHLGMQEFVWDGIKRGQTVWAGDLYPAAATIAAVFGPQGVVGASLDHLRDEYDDPDDPGCPEWLNSIPTYSLWWVVIQADWYRLGGDLAYLAAQRVALGRLIAVLDREVDADGREAFEGWRYLDWATTHDTAAVAAGTRGLLAWALRSARAIAGILGDDAIAEDAEAILRRVEAARPLRTASKAAQALLALGGLANPAAVNRDSLAVDPAAGLTPFLGYAVLEARALAGDHAGAIDLIREYWGAMVDLGATTFWEDFELDWVAGSGRIDAIVPPGRRDIHAGLGRNRGRGFGLSLCHPWSAGPTAWLTRHVLGVTPDEPGGRVVRVGPHLGDLDWTEGSVPLASGVVRVRHERRDDGSIATEVDAPPGVRVLMAP